MKHTQQSNIRQKILSFALGLSLLFNIFAPVAVVFAQDVAPPDAPVTSWQLTDANYQAVSEDNPIKSGASYALTTEIHLQGLEGGHLVVGSTYQVKLPVNAEVGTWSGAQATPKALVSKSGETICSFVIQNQTVLLTLNEAVTELDQVDAVIQTDAVLTTNVNQDVTQAVQVGNISQNIAFITATKAKPAPRAAAVIYNANTLIAQGIMTNVQVTWSTSENNVTQTAAFPTKLTFTIEQNSILNPGDIINFGYTNVTGARVGQTTPQGSGYVLANGDSFNGSNRYTFGNAYSNQSSLTTTLNFSGVGGTVSNGDTSITLVTSTFLNSVCHTIYTWQSPPPALTNFSGYSIIDSSTGPVAGKGIIQLRQNNLTYLNNALNGNYDPTAGAAPTGNVVSVWHINAADVDKIDLSTMQRTTNEILYMYILTPDGESIARNLTSNTPFGTSASQNTSLNAGNVLTADMTDQEVVSTSPPNSSGWVKNTDGSLTVYVNQGSLDQSRPATQTQVTAAVKGNAWSGTDEGVANALMALGNPLMGINGYNATATFNFNVIDSSIVNLIGVSSKTYSTDGYVKDMGTRTINIPKVPGGEQEGQSMIKVHYVNQDGSPLKAISSSVGWPVGSIANPAGDTLTISANSLKITGYHLDTSKLPTNISGVDPTTGAVVSIPYPTQGTTLDITYTYEQDTYTVAMSKVAQTIHYVDDQNNTIAPDSVQYVTFTTVTNDYTGEVTRYYQTGDHTGTTVISTDGTLPYPWISGTSTNFGVVVNPTITGLHWISSSVTGDTASGTSAQAVTNQGPNQNITVTYAADIYTISYVLGGGNNSLSNPATYTYGVGVTSFADATGKTGYTFAGWYDDATAGNLVTTISTTETGNKTLYARWTPNEYDIVYHLDGGDNDSANPAKYTYDVGVASFEDATKDGYHFLGWYDAAEGGNLITNISSTATGTKDLYAHWDYTITYELDGGTNGTNPTHYEFGTGVTSFNPASKDGHDFQGWYDADTGGNKVTNIPATAKEDKTLYARFTPSEYTIAYELDGGTNSTANPDTYTYGVGVPSFEDATKDGYIFLGWFDDATAGNAITDISDTAMGNQTLYAHFKYDYARLEAKPIVRTVVKNTTYTWHHPEHEPVLYDEDNNIVPDADIWAIVDGVAYKATDAAELPEGVHDVTFTNVNPMTRFTPFNRLVTRATVREVTTHTTATILAKDLEPAPITVRYVDQSGKELKTSTVYTGKIGDAITSNAPAIAGYELISLSDKITATITDQAQTFTFVYKPVTQTPALPPTGQQLPKTGESQSVLNLILGFILVALVSILTWFKLGKRNTRHSD